MDSQLIHPELRGVIGRIPAIPFHNRGFLYFLRAVLKILPRAREFAGGTITEHKLKSAGVRVYRPTGEVPGAALLWIHGGGLILGNAAQDGPLCIRYAQALGLVVVSVEYRLAPEHPFPCALEDCLAAWHWLQANARGLGVDPARIAISGHSAGGGLAASLAQGIRDQGGIQPAAQALFCPMLDDRTAARRELDSVNHPIWNNRNNRGGWRWYLGQEPGAPALPDYAVPARREDLSGLPPAWIGVGDVDLFYEESRDYAARLKAAGVDCRFDPVPMAPHAFETFVPGASISRDYLGNNHRFLGEALGL